VTVAAGARPRERPAEGQLDYAPLDWVVVRAPLLPAGTCDRLDEATRDATADPGVRTALAVGAPDLLDAVERAGGDPAAGGKVRRKLQRYLIRMSTRPTPYGLFAGVALARPGPSTDLAIGPGEPETRTRPDMAWLMSFIAELEQRPEVRRQLRFRANTAARLAGGRLFLDERAVTGELEHGGGAVSVRATAAAQAALALAREPCRWAQLAEALLETPGATTDKVERLLTELWRQTLLLSELRPPLTSGSPARYVAERLRDVPAASEARRKLEALLDEVAAWDARPLRVKAEAYPSLAALARDVHPGPDGAPLQVDARLPLAGERIAEEVAEEAARGAGLLLRLGPIGAGSTLAGYRASFEQRYGPERELPLLELLDPEAGLGPPSHRDWSTDADPERSARRDALLWELAAEATRDRRPELELDEATIAALEAGRPPREALPACLELAVFVLADGPESIDRGDFRVLVGPNLGAQAAGRNLGRFADLLGPDAERALASAARADERHRPHEVAAELVYLPVRARSANVAVRPAVRSHEIVLGTSPGVTAERTIPLDELVVGIRGGRFYVRWPRGDCELRVRQGHMLNTFQAPAVCRFLADVAGEGTMDLTPFDWGSAGRLPYLPRVVAGRVVLQPARWRIDAVARDRELPPGNPDEFAAALRRWRDAWSAPARVYLSVGDNRLLLDLDDAEQVEQLREELRRVEEAGPVVLEEALPDPRDSWLPGPGGRYVTEMVVPLVLRGPPAERPLPEPRGEATRPIRAASSAVRLRAPGSDWLFLKLYVPRAAEEEIIAGPVRELGEFVTAAGLAAEWFFVRYADPDPHLRLRFRGDPGTLLARLLPELCGWATELLEGGRCSRFGFDTYEREVERYGGDEATAVAESLFAADSRAVADLLRVGAGPAATLDRTSLAVLSIDDLLAGLGLDESRRLEWYREQVTARHESGDEHRRRGRELRQLLGRPEDAAGDVHRAAVAETLAARREALAPLAERLAALEAAGRLDSPLALLCRSYVHLHFNRLLGNGPPSEGLLLGLLLRAREGLERAPVGSS
jgi:lantibiotic biosynthesis protein